MMGRLLVRGMLLGILAGLLTFGVGRLLGEPQVDRAIAFEEQVAQARHEAPEPEIVSRPTQAGWGLLTGSVVFGAALGGLFTLGFAVVQGRLSADPRVTAGVVALGGFVAVELVPFLKYPANPPSVGDPETIGTRTALYFTYLLVSVLAAIAAAGTGRRLAARIGGWNAGLVAVAAYLAVVGVAALILPSINEVPDAFSAVLLWRFRLASLAMQATLYTVLGLGFGLLAERVLPARAPRLAPRTAWGR